MTSLPKPILRRIGKYIAGYDTRDIHEPEETLLDDEGYVIIIFVR